MKQIFLMVSMLVLLAAATSCEDPAVAKVKMKAAKFNDECPIHTFAGDLVSVQYDDADKALQLKFTTTEEASGQYFDERNSKNTLDNLRLTLQNDVFKQILNDLIKADSGIEFTYTVEATGESVHYDFSCSDLKEIVENPMSEKDRNKIILQNKTANENNRCPYEIMPGVEVVKVELTDDNMIWHCRVDEDEYDFNLIKESTSDIQEAIEETFNQARRDPALISEFKMMIKEGVGYDYHFYGSDSNDSFDIVFTPRDMKRILR